MNKSLIIASAGLLCIVLILAAGCTQPATPPVTPTPTPVATTVPSTPTPTPTSVSSTPGPTQTLPEIWSLDVQVRGNGESIDPQIIATVQGGKGLNFILQVDVRVTRPDGIVENGIIAKPLSVGKSVSLPVTSQMGNVNRVEVWATNPQGEKVKIFDDYVPFRTYN
ncbi:MAG: hypothetical protein NTZ37_09580 [Methanoregula sp.]|jgi:hypothetical protein|nr:hypothetical protein [Methanoregula sp.]